MTEEITHCAACEEHEWLYRNNPGIEKDMELEQSRITHLRRIHGLLV